MRDDLRRGAPLDLRDRRAFAGVVAWCTGLGGMLLVSVLGLPPGSPLNVAGALLAAAGMLTALVMLLLARWTPRPSQQPGALLEDGEALTLVTDLGVDPLAPWIALYLVGMALLSAASVRLVNRAHVADAILACGIGHALLSSALVRALGPTLARANRVGLTLVRGWRLRSLPWSELREVGALRGDLQLTRLDGERVRLRSSRLPGEERSRLRARIEAGIAAASGPRPARAELLAREGRTLRAWRRALARLVVDEGYREHGLSVEEAEAVLEAPRAPAEERVGAAFALAGSGQPRAHERIRAAAATCRDRRLRAALLEATVDEPREATVERALPRVDRR